MRSHLVSVAVALCLAGMTVGQAGCRGLRSWNREQGITEARQFSLRGADALQIKKFDDAETLFAEALRRCPTDERAHWGMAEVYSHKGNCQAATVHMGEASRLSGNNPDLLVRLGEMHLSIGQTELALQQAEMALLSNRQHAAAWHLRGRIHQQQERWQEAIDCFHRALMAKPNNPEVQMAVASIYQRLGRPQRALATLERISDLQSTQQQTSRVLLLKGQALAGLGQSEDAIVCLREALRQADTTDGSFYLELAQLQHDLGQIAEARISLGHALQLQPTNHQALTLQARLDQRFASLVAAGPSNATNAMIDTIAPATLTDQPAGMVPAQTSVYQVPRD